MSLIDRSGSLHSWGMKLRQVGRMQIGRLLGSVPNTHGGYKALIDLLERCYFMRAEINAVASLLIEKKVITVAEWQKGVDEEFGRYFAAVAKDWPEIEFGDDGFTIKDAQALAERSKRERWPP
jgi:hypothetical protein